MGKVQSVLPASRFPRIQLGGGRQRRHNSDGFWGSKTTIKTRIIYRKPKPYPRAQALALNLDVPEITTRPKAIPVTSLPNFDGASCQFVIFDLETTGLKMDAEICQIAAMGTDMWSTYILPTTGIDPSASLVTGLVVKYAGNERYLTFCGKCVEAVTYNEGILSFYAHLKELSTKAKHTILIGYNSKTFDVPILVRNFRKVGILGDQLDTFGVGFVDALDIVREMKKDVNLTPDTAGTVARRSLSEVYKNLFKETFRAHEAVRDVKALHRILFQSPLPITPEVVLTRATTAGSVYSDIEFRERRSKLLSTMYGKLFDDNPGSKLVISRYMANKIAASGLSYEDLQRVYQQHGRDGIAAVCCTPCHTEEGKATYRITKDKEIIDALSDHFEMTMAKLPDIVLV